MPPSERLRRALTDQPDEAVIRVLRTLSPAERVRLASEMYADARRMLLVYLRAMHIDWTEVEVTREVVRRLSHDTG